jgi:hypothetical protein
MGTNLVCWSPSGYLSSHQYLLLDLSPFSYLSLTTMMVAVIIHLNTIVQASVFGEEHVSKTLSFMNTLDTFTRFYISKLLDSVLS